MFNKREFEEDIRQINWDEIISPENGTDQSLPICYQKILRLLDEMTPLKKFTKKEQGL